jgi:membrane fusion protein, multidrug efflux system
VKSTIPFNLPLLGAAFLLQACEADSGANKSADRRPSQVGYIVVRASNVPVVTELSGRVAAFQLSEVRPQVAGLIRRRYFIEGAIVRKGQTLFQIDPSLYEASAAEARAELNSAAATAEAARVRAERYLPLAQIEAVSRQEYTDSVAQSRQAAANVALSRAQLDTARINLSFTRVPAPITGRIGRALATEGALVSTNQAEPLAIIQRLDPVYVDIQQASAELLALRRSLSSEGLAAGDAEMQLMLEDGSPYELSGRVSFTETIVDPATGTVTLRARFPNPSGLLLPGMFVRARLVQSVDMRVFLVPQPAVKRLPNGEASVFIVGPGNRAVERKVVATRTQGANWVVTQGLKDGDRVISQNSGRLRPNAPILAVPANTPQRIARPKTGG